MRYLLIPALALITVAADAAAQRGQGRRGGRQAPVALEHFEFKEVEFDSKNLTEGSGSFGLYLPKGWDAEDNEGKKLPLVVWLHGFGGYAEFQRRGGAATLDRLLGAGEISPMAFATFRAPGGRRSRTVYINGEVTHERAVTPDMADPTDPATRIITTFTATPAADAFVVFQVEGDGTARNHPVNGERPFALTNPIFVDVDGDGLRFANGM